MVQNIVEEMKSNGRVVGLEDGMTCMIAFVAFKHSNYVQFKNSTFGNIVIPG